MTRTRFFRFLTITLLVVGVLSLFYPFSSNIFYEVQQKKIIKEYNEQVENLSEDEAERMLEEARKYNEKLQDSSEDNNIVDEEAVSGNLAYSELLQVMGEQMGYIVIPKINVDLPIYHYTSDDVLTVGIGHLEDSSLPVGGESTHCVLTGHSGLIKAKLFTDLEKLQLGDKFYIKTLNEVLCYEVEQILTVLPDDTSELKIIEGRDLVTLITCTPYGVNSHRLLVRGTRVEYNGEIDEPEEELILTSEASPTEAHVEVNSGKLTISRVMWIGIFVFGIILMLIIVVLLFLKMRRHRRWSKKDDGDKL